MHFLIPGNIDTRTGGYRYDKRIIEQLEQLGWHVTLHSLDDSFPFPTDAALDDCARRLAALADDSLVVIDGLAYGAMPDIARTMASRMRLIALVHHPLALETGLSTSEQQALFTSEKAALAYANTIIVTSPSTATALVDYGVEDGRVCVVRPATSTASLSVGTVDREPERGLRLLCVASLTRRKGHDTLIDALARLAHHPWELICAGSPRHDPEQADALRRQISALGLESRITLAGEMDDAALNAAYHQADVFVLASHYEGYGMVFDEALARGLPIVSTTGGAIPDTVPDSAGELVAPGDPIALANTLERLMTDPMTRSRLRDGAIEARRHLRGWTLAGREFQSALQMGRQAAERAQGS